MDLLYRAYERVPSGALHHVATGQWLVPGAVTADRMLFEYRDREIELPIRVRLTQSGPPHPSSYFGREAIVDWNLREHAVVRNDYGLWRRLTWYLLDALLVWLIEGGGPQRSVLITGGWFNGSWLEKGRFFLTGSRPEAGASEIVEDIPSYDPVPLRTAAPLWQFEPGLPGTREGRIAVRPGDSDLPVADVDVPIDRQVADVPRFVGSDGSILFFHRVFPHAGPEYAPAMDYGLVGKDYAFYFRAGHGTLIDTPIALRPDRGPYNPRLRERIPDLYRQFLSVQDRWRLHPSLREQLFFAGAEAYALFFEVPRASRPMMRSVEHAQDMPFGDDLSQIYDAPISVGLRAELRSWPGLATEQR